MSPPILRWSAVMGLAALGAVRAPALGQNLPALVINDVAVREGAAGAAANAVFTVSLSAASTDPVTVSFSTANRTATGGVCGDAGIDYGKQGSSLTLIPGRTAERLSIPICGDGVREGDEHFYVRLSGASNATIEDGTGVATIIDDEPLPALSIAATTEVPDPAGNSWVSVDVTLGGPPTTQTVTVQFATSPGTATAGDGCGGGVEYVSTRGTLTFSPGETRKTVQVKACAHIDDTGAGVLDEPNEPDEEAFEETFTVVLSSPVNATIARGTGRVVFR